MKCQQNIIPCSRLAYDSDPAALAIPVYIDAVDVVARAANNTAQKTRADKSRFELEVSAIALVRCLS